MLSFVNGTPVAIDAIPTLAYEEFRKELTGEEFEKSLKRVVALWQLPDGRIACVLGNPATKQLEIMATDAASYKPMAEEVPAVHRFEAELRGEENMRPFNPLKGEAAHEVAVGPVHAGVIEPGHFRFQCMGEDVHYLEIALGYQHRGAEKLIADAKNDTRRFAIAETIAGDSSVAASVAAHVALGYGAGNCELALELERIANHVGDLGALAGDVAYLPTASFCGRIRGEYLNMTAQLCGNRFGRGMWDKMAQKTADSSPNGAKPAMVQKTAVDQAAGSAPDCSEPLMAQLKEWFMRTGKELFHALDLLFSEGSAMERFEGTGRVDAKTARAIGLIGMAGRASGLAVDSRIDFPMEGESTLVPLCGEEEMKGDVRARASQRYLELLVSHARVRRLLSAKKRTVPTQIPACNRKPGTVTVAVVEAWRGELVHIAVTESIKNEELRIKNEELRIKNGACGEVPVVQYKVFDPSCHNWFGLAQALRGEQISNFPICNKSFNLSYCGVDK